MPKCGDPCHAGSKPRLPAGAPAVWCPTCKRPSHKGKTSSYLCVKCDKTFAVFGFKGEPRATFCRADKLEGMVDVKNKKCVVCTKHQPTFGAPGCAQATHCFGCKLDDMIDSKHKLCKCGKHRPTFGTRGIDQAKCCRECKTRDMVDLVSPMCQACGVVQATFGLLRSNPTHCLAHKEAGTWDVRNAACEQCGERALYGKLGSRPTRCGAHRCRGMLNHAVPSAMSVRIRHGGRCLGSREGRRYAARITRPLAWWTS